MTARRFATEVRATDQGRVFVPVPFDPDEVWGAKSRHHVTGTVDAVAVRGVVETFGTDRGLVLTPSWRRDHRLVPGDHVEVELVPEGPQRGELAEDVAAALDADPAAGAFFDSLAQFYRRAYLRWVDGTRNRPELRAARIAEMTGLLAAGVKQRPRS